MAVVSANVLSTNIHRDSVGLQRSLSSVNHADGAKGIKNSIDWSIESLDSYVDSQNTIELIVGVNNTAANKNQVTGLVSQNGGQVIDTVSMGEKVSFVVKVPVSVASGFVDRVHNSGISNYVEPNGEYKIDSTPNDPSWSQQWGPQRMSVDNAWNTIAGSSSLLVAVIDTGIDYTHPDLLANYIPLGYDFVNNDQDPKDDNGHGTHCSGIIAATINNSLGIAGTANVKIMAEKGLDASGSGSYFDLANCIIHATDAGANILSNSWGGGDQSDTIAIAVDYAISHGVLFIAAAGNKNSAQYYYPAAYENVVAVSATNPDDSKASFSNYGSWVDVAAPGVNIFSTMPKYTVTLNTERGYPLNYASLSGTSMACPGVAGVAALIWSQYPTMTAPFVRAQLEATCEDIGDSGFDNYFGYGLVNAQRGVEEEPVEHDLAAQTWEKPSYSMLGVAQTFNVTAVNRGSMDETDVELQLIVNGTMVDTETIPNLAAYHTDSRVVSWTPQALGTYNVTYYVVPAFDESEITFVNNQLAVNYLVVGDPSTDGWTQIASGPDYNLGCTPKAAYSQLQSDVVFFKVDYYRNWNNALEDIDTAILLDVDQNISTGMPQNYYPGQNDSIGSDFMILVGKEGTEIWRWNYNTRAWDIPNPINILYLDAPNNSATFVVGVLAGDLETDGVFDCSFSDIYTEPDDTTYWIWMPIIGYVPYIAQSSPHDLVVTLETPRICTPQTIWNFTAKVFNFGLNSESDIDLMLYIDGAMVASSNFAALESGESGKVSTLEVLPTGFYNITACSVQKDGEVSIDNNERTRIMPVSQKIAVISDNDELWTTLNILDSMNINYDYGNYNFYYSYTSDLDLLSSYPVVITYNYARNISAQEQTTFNKYLEEFGGNLLVTGMDSLYYSDALLGYVVRATSEGDATGQGDLVVEDDTHPIMNNGYGDFPVGYHITGLVTDNDAIQADTARNAVAIAKLVDEHAKIIVTDSLPGKVVFWNGVGSDDWIYNSDCQAMFKNTMLWFLDGTAPTTTDDYNEQWHTSDFTINLSAQDYFGVKQTSYIINGGETQTVAVNGQPQITTEAADNTLEYWSTDLSGNEETHHTLFGVKLDKTSPSGSVQIDGGNIYVTLNSVTLTLTATDATSGVLQVRYSNDGTWDTETWEAFAPTKPWTLASGEGEKTVYYQVQDNAGLTSLFIDKIILDTTNPAGSVTIDEGATYTVVPNVELTLTLTDANSGSAQMCFSNDNISWNNWEYFSSTKQWTLSDGEGAKTVYAKFKDNAGLTSQTYWDTIILDTAPPTGTIEINGGVQYTNSATVTLTLSLTDTNFNAAEMRFSNDNSHWCEWQDFATTKSWSLEGEEGVKTVYVQFKDNAGLTSAYSASITLDVTAPIANAGSSQTVTQGTAVSFDGSASHDSSGITSYYWDFGDTETNTDTSPTHTYSDVGTYTVKLLVTDGAGNTAQTNINIFVQATVTPTPTPSPTANPTTNPTATPTPTASPTSEPFPTPTPTQTPAPESLNVTKTDGTITDQIVISGGNISITQISNAKTQTDQTAQTTTISFTITGEAGTTGTSNITIPKSQVPLGSKPVVYIDNLPIDSQGYTQDAENYYVWFTTHFSTNEVKIVFQPAEQPQTMDSLIIVAVIVAVIVCAAVVTVVLLRRSKIGV